MKNADLLNHALKLVEYDPQGAMDIGYELLQAAENKLVVLDGKRNQAWMASFGFLHRYSALIVDASERVKDANLLGTSIRIMDKLYKLERSNALLYNKLNAYLNIVKINSYNHWDNDSREIISMIKDLYYLIKNSSEDNELDRKIKIMSTINYAGFLRSVCGRPVESLVLYEAALKSAPNHPVALHGRGSCVIELSGAVSEEVRNEFIRDAIIDYAVAVKHDHDKVRSEATKMEICKYTSYNESISQVSKCSDDDVESIGDEREKKIIRYNKENSLYLNAFTSDHNCSGLYYDSIVINQARGLSSRDVIIFDYFNSVKSQYVLARDIHDQAIFNGVGNAWSDNNVRYVDTGSGYMFNMASSKLIESIKISVSLYDRVSYVLNEYLDVGLTERRVNILKFATNSNTKSKEVEKMRRYIKNDKEKSKYLFGVVDMANDLCEGKLRYIRGIRNMYEHKMGFILVEDKESECVEKNKHTYELIKKVSLESLQLAKSMLVNLALIITEREYSGGYGKEIFLENL